MSARISTANTELVLSLGPAIKSVIAWYTDAARAVTAFTSLFIDPDDMGLSQLEKKLESLTGYLAFIQRNPSFIDFGNLSRTKNDIAEVEAAISRIKAAGEKVVTNGGPVANLVPSSSIVAISDNLAEMEAKLYAAAGGLEAFGKAGRDGLAAFEKRTDLVVNAEALADAFNRTNKAAIDGGLAVKRFGGDYLPVLEDLVDLEERRADALKIDGIIADLGEQERFARTRLELGEDEANVQRLINGYRSDGLEISNDLEARIRASVGETERLNAAWEDNRQRVEDSEKTAADLAADRCEFPADFTDFDRLIAEALL